MGGPIRVFKAASQPASHDPNPDPASLGAEQLRHAIGAVGMEI